MSRREPTPVDRKQRIATACKVAYLRLNEPVAAVSEDISHHGAFVRTDLYLPRGEILELSITLPDDRVVRVLGRVAHILPRGAARALGRHPGMGLEFQGPLPDDLLAFLDRRRDELASAERPSPADVVLVIADSSPPILERLRISLGAAGFDVRTTTTAEGALEKCRTRATDILLADADLVSAADWSLLKRLPQEADLEQVGVMLMAQDPSDMARLEAYRLGVMDFIHKPFSDEEMSIRLRRAAGTRRSAHRGVLRGSIGDTGIGTVLALLEFERRSGVLIVLREERAARVLVREGQSVKVEMPRGADSRANLFEVLSWSRGSFEFIPTAVDDADEIGMPTSHVLLEHARLHDEGGREGELEIEEEGAPSDSESSFGGLDSETEPAEAPLPASAASAEREALAATAAPSEPSREDVTEVDGTQVSRPSRDDVSEGDRTQVSAPPREDVSDGDRTQVGRPSREDVSEGDRTQVSRPQREDVSEGDRTLVSPPAREDAAAGEITHVRQPRGAAVGGPKKSQRRR